ncbi:MAG: PepSY-like domain-containing protein [Cytophagales bacterium]
MKKTFAVFVSVVMFSCSAQKTKDVPQKVKDVFSKQYPQASEVKWDKEAEGYEVSFDLNEVDYSLLIDSDGNVLETEVEIKSNELPSVAQEYLNKNYAGKKVKEYAKITDAKGQVSYEVEVGGVDLMFDSKGNFLKQIDK